LLIPRVSRAKIKKRAESWQESRCLLILAQFPRRVAAPANWSRRFLPFVAPLMALSNVSLADFHTRCVYAAFGVRASVIQHSRESLWKEEFGSFHDSLSSDWPHTFSKV